MGRSDNRFPCDQCGRMFKPYELVNGLCGYCRGKGFMRWLIIVIACLSLGLYTGMIQAEIIEVVDDDETQWIRFYECADYDSFTVGISLNDDTVYAEYAYQPTDSLCIPQAFNMFTFRDERDRVLPGIHIVTYAFYIDSWLDGDRIASPDTVHMTATKPIPGGCNPISILHID